MIERDREVGERLTGLAARIERVSVDPRPASGLSRLTAPLLRMVGWQPVFERRALAALRGAIAAEAYASAEGEAARIRAIEAAFGPAVEELGENVERAETAAMVYGQISIPRAAWLGRVLRLLLRLSRALAVAEEPVGRRALRRGAVAALEPLAVRGGASPAPFEAPAPPGGGEAATPAAPARGASTGAAGWGAPSQLIELQLAAIDHVMDAALAETQVLERRRALLVAARRLLLDAAAAMPLDQEGVAERARLIADGIVGINRLQGAGLRADADLLHQARGFLARGDRERLTTALLAMDAFALGSGELTAARRSGAALEALARGAESKAPEGGGPIQHAPLAEAAHGRGVAAAEAALGRGVVAAIRDGYAAGRARLETPAPGERETYRLALDYLAPGGEHQTLSAMTAVDGCFDVGAALTPVRAEEIEATARLVSYPTQEMVLAPARGVDDLPGAVIEDPRRVLLDLAAGRLLARRFVELEERRRTRRKLIGEVRIYLLDGSTSMLEEGERGARARMRDALLLAELATVLRRYEAPERSTRVVLYYRYFTKRLHPLRKVASAAEALAAMGEVVRKTWSGGTNIERALLHSFALVRRASAEDPDLARAQIVLVTDGEAKVRAEAVQAAREKAGAVPIGVSVIALGQENAALRALVARQRSLGEKAFYHHLDDRVLADAAEGRIGPSQIPIERPEAALDADTARVVGDVLEELSELSSAPGEAKGAGQAPSTEGEAARRDSRNRDEDAVMARFQRWFPAPAPGGEPAPPAQDDDLDAVRIALSTVAEVIGVVGRAPVFRQADAIEIVERLLPDARLSPLRYQEILDRYPTAVAPALEAVRRAAGARA